jgi:ABC-type microcin C transport system duplicated ATPase subunit YejF
MKDGDVVEEGLVDKIFDSPESDYTKNLMLSALNTPIGETKKLALEK